MSLAREVKKKVKEVGFAVVGISNLGLLRDLPYGNIRYIGELRLLKQNFQLSNRS
jgi:hypothetical protein